MSPQVVRFQNTYLDPYPTEIVGESNYQSAFEAIFPNYDEDEGVKEDDQVATLILENNNPYDPNAVRVEIEQHQVGYLSKNDAKNYRNKLIELGIPDATGLCYASIRGGFRKRSTGEMTNFGVRLDMDLINLKIEENLSTPIISPEKITSPPNLNPSPVNQSLKVDQSQKKVNFINRAFSKKNWWKTVMIFLILFTLCCCISFYIIGATQ